MPGHGRIRHSLRDAALCIYHRGRLSEQTEGKGAIAIDGEMVDAATLKMAEIVSAKADAAGL